MTITDKQVNAAQDAYRKHVAEHGVEGSIEAMRAALEAADAAAWEPIATAPRDGTPVLVATSDGVTIAAYGKASHVPFYGFVPIGQDPEDRDLCSPTHWRPIPASPKGA